MSSRKWKYTGSVNPDRKRCLKQAPPFAAIVSAVQDEMRVLCGHEDTCKDDSQFSRVVYSIQLPKRLFDWVFNSANGYRAWFFRSHYDGLRNNKHLMDALAPALFESIKVSGNASLGLDSLNSLYAKVWLAERGNEVCFECHGCEGEWGPARDDTAEILNGRWELSADPRAKDGRKAPYLTKLRIFGGFLNKNGDEWISARKRHRARHIHDYGWA